MPERSRVNPRTFRFALEAVATGTAQGAGAGNNQMQLVAAGVAADDEFNQRFIVITGGTGLGQSPRRIINTDNATDTVTVEPAWTTNPDATTTYAVFTALLDEPFVGLAQAGAASSITLGDRESLKDGFYEGLDIEIIAGTGWSAAQASQKRRIINYVGATRVATIASPWTTNPDATSQYRIQGHLYFPCTAIEAWNEAASNLWVSHNPGGLGFLNYIVTTQYSEFDNVGDNRRLEIAMAAGTGVLDLKRWE